MGTKKYYRPATWTELGKIHPFAYGDPNHIANRAVGGFVERDPTPQEKILENLTR